MFNNKKWNFSGLILKNFKIKNYQFEKRIFLVKPTSCVNVVSVKTFCFNLKLQKIKKYSKKFELFIYFNIKAKAKTFPSKILRTFKEKLYLKQNFKCKLCNKIIDLEDNLFNIHHNKYFLV